MTNPTLQEQETALTMSADDRGTWSVFSEDVVMHRKFESIGAVLVKQDPGGLGKWYTLRADQVLLRKGKARRGPLSEAQRAALQRSQFRPKSLDGNANENMETVQQAQSSTETPKHAKHPNRAPWKDTQR